MIITQMREYIEQHGWHQGNLFEGVSATVPPA